VVSSTVTMSDRESPLTLFHNGIDKIVEGYELQPVSILSDTAKINDLGRRSTAPKVSGRL
jgi:hypothetical protein